MKNTAPATHKPQPVAAWPSIKDAKPVEQVKVKYYAGLGWAPVA